MRRDSDHTRRTDDHPSAGGGLTLDHRVALKGGAAGLAALGLGAHVAGTTAADAAERAVSSGGVYAH